MLLWMVTLGSIGCGGGDNTTCTVGTLLCTDSHGEVTQDGDAQLRECTDDTSRGGDEDGEFVVVEDCAASGGACALEWFAEGEDVGACITRECADDGIVDCLQPGRTMCSGFGGLLVCGTEPVSGCQRYQEDPACADSGGTCVEQGGEAVCEAG